MRLQKGDVYRGEDGRLYVHNGHGGRLIYWSKQMLDDFRRLFPVTSSEELRGIFGMSGTTITRKARELGLRKSPEYIKRVRGSAVRLAHAGLMRKYASGWRGNGEKNLVKYKKGHKFTAEELAKRSAAARRRFQNAAERRRISEKMKAYWADPENRRRGGERAKANWRRKKSQSTNQSIQS